MKNKVLINVYVPTLNEEYEIYIPVNELMQKVVELVIKCVSEISEVEIDESYIYHLLDPNTSTIYMNDKIVRDTNIRNGKKLILIKEKA